MFWQILAKNKVGAVRTDDNACLRDDSDDEMEPAPVFNLGDSVKFVRFESRRHSLASLEETDSCFLSHLVDDE